MDAEGLKRRTKTFAHRCVKFAPALPDTPLGRHIQGQLIRCATSVAANYRAACYAQSKPTFVTKLGIVIEEAAESAFWIEFAIDENLTKRSAVADLLEEANELLSIFASSRITARKKQSPIFPSTSRRGELVELSGRRNRQSSIDNLQSLQSSIEPATALMGGSYPAGQVVFSS